MLGLSVICHVHEFVLLGESEDGCGASLSPIVIPAVVIKLSFLPKSYCTLEGFCEGEVNGMCTRTHIHTRAHTQTHTLYPVYRDEPDRTFSVKLKLLWGTCKGLALIVFSFSLCNL